MLSKKERLPREVVLRQTHNIKEALYSIRYTPNALPQNRFRVIVSLAVSKKATERHRIKRIISDAVRVWPIRGLDVVINIFPSASTKPKKELSEALSRTGSVLSNHLKPKT